MNNDKVPVKAGQKRKRQEVESNKYYFTANPLSEDEKGWLNALLEAGAIVKDDSRG